MDLRTPLPPRGIHHYVLSSRTWVTKGGTYFASRHGRDKASNSHTSEDFATANASALGELRTWVIQGGEGS